MAGVCVMCQTCEIGQHICELTDFGFHMRSAKENTPSLSKRQTFHEDWSIVYSVLAAGVLRGMVNGLTAFDG